ncbi:tetratricopeptide repeat protein [Streptomyces sp. NPDC059002]|uniref:tetratricopeptide repeat protein n=1 Tax=Streptomyces sp. NPDC059002 TaxID=3346690 RepID=UPI003691CEAF
MTARPSHEIRADVFRLDDEPYGSARNARAEALTDEAAATGDRPLLVEALTCLVNAYSFSAECNKMFVPFARLLRMYDEDPADFDEDDVHQLHWMFKWVAGDARQQHDVPLASIEEWLTEMRRRYRVAGYSERAVHGSEFMLARHLGDTARAARAHAAWTAAERDEMSDCLACECALDGLWQLERGDDHAALKGWRPVLDGTHGCNREPHETLARSLLPLVRLGEQDRARAHHLRGYRMVRSDETFGPVAGLHIEFCARTGNEPRGLEILAEQSARWTQRGDPLAHHDWLVSTALLMRRLVELGHAERPVPGPPGRAWTAAALLDHARTTALGLAARFDARNATTSVSDRARRTMAAEPLCGALPLGLRAEPLGSRAEPLGSRAEPLGSRADSPGARADSPGPRAGDEHPVRAEDPDELLALAREFTQNAHPWAGTAWRRAAAALDARGTPLGDADRADALDAAALDLDGDQVADGVGLFGKAAEAHERAGRPGRALVSRARSLLCRPDAMADPDTPGRLGQLRARAEALHAEGGARTVDVVTLGLLHCRVRAALLPGGGGAGDGDGDGAYAATAAAEVGSLNDELDRLIDFARRHIDEPAVLTRIAGATELLGLLAVADDTGAAVELFGRAVTRHHEAGRPWLATNAEIQLARTLLTRGEHQQAATVVRDVLDDPERVRLLAPRDRARLCLTLARTLTGPEEGPEEGALLIDAAHFADLAGESAGLGALARLRLGGHYCERGRHHEAASVLEAVLPDLAAGHDENDVVQARVWLAHSYVSTDEPALAAEQFALAADTARHWPDQHHHAALTQQAAEALGLAGLGTESVRAYERAADLWRGLGESGAVVRALRARAWETLGAAGPDAAEAVMTHALDTCDEAARTTRDGAERAELRIELGRTHMQLAQLQLERTDGPPSSEQDTPGQYAVNVAAYERSLVCAERAAAAFDACGEAGHGDLFPAQLFAVRLEWGLARTGAAADRARRLATRLRGLPDDPDGSLAQLIAMCDEFTAQGGDGA